ncbi:MAG TPA: VOC family protein [Polyangium sp.]|nr:VOC family protein [Polyangium sp.]
MTESTYRHGHIVWHELMAPDGAAAEKFYGELFGWSFKYSDMGGKGTYRVIVSGGREQGGIFQTDPNDPIRAHWAGYVSVPDVDAAAKTAAEHGGRVPCAPMDIPNVGRFAYVLDPEGAGFIVFRDNRGDVAPPEMPGAGDFCWDTLAVHNGEQALAFYAAVAGWTRGKFGDAPNLFLATGAGQTIVDVEAPQGGAPSHWMTHVVVPKLAEARAKAESLGARIYAPQIDVPGVGQMAVIGDPWGAVISLFEPAMS